MKKRKIFLIISIILIIICIDQSVKILVERFVHDYNFNNFLKIEYSENTGLAFGFNDGNIKNIFLIIFALGIIINFIVKQFEQIDTGTMVSISMVLGGGFSNLIDRFIRGCVLDFIKILNFPNFNIADSFIVIGWILIVVFLIKFTKNGRDISA